MFSRDCGGDREEDVGALLRPTSHKPASLDCL